MKRYLLILFIAAAVFSQQPEIKSLLVYSSSPKSLPVIINSEKLTIEFDLAAQSEPNLIIKFEFCDKNWVPYESAFLTNQGYNTAYNLYFEQIPVPSGDIRYHFKDSYPNIDVTFPFSGKWRFFITDGNDPDDIYAEGKFYVVKNPMPVRANLSEYRLSSSIEQKVELQRALELRVDFTLPDTLHRMDLDYVEVVENQKINYPIKIKQDRFNNLRFFETDGASRYTFVARDIKPGNEYRQTDLRNTNEYRPPVTQAHFDGFDYNRFESPGARDFNGGLQVVPFTDRYADYMTVEFEYSPLNYLSEDVFLVGSFTDWNVLPEYKLTNQGGLLKTDVELKRGVYDYQYVTGTLAGADVENIDWYKLEGNFWVTSNDYYIFIYYNTLKLGGYDKIIGYSKINSGQL